MDKRCVCCNSCKVDRKIKSYFYHSFLYHIFRSYVAKENTTEPHVTNLFVNYFLGFFLICLFVFSRFCFFAFFFCSFNFVLSLSYHVLSLSLQTSSLYTQIYNYHSFRHQERFTTPLIDTPVHNISFVPKVPTEYSCIPYPDRTPIDNRLFVLSNNKFVSNRIELFI